MWLVVSIESCFLGELLGGVAEDQEATLRMACCVSSTYNPQQLLQHAVYITVLQSNELHSADLQNFNALHGLLLSSLPTSHDTRSEMHTLDSIGLLSTELQCVLLL